jgi:autotransporter-associated beta strand protein
MVGSSTAAGSIGASSPISIGDTASLTLTNVLGSNFENNVMDATGGTVLLKTPGTLTIGGAITGGGQVIAYLPVSSRSSPMVILTATNTYSGPTNVRTGTLQIGDGTSGIIASSSLVTIDRSGTLALNLANGGVFSNNMVDNGQLSATGANNYTIAGIVSGTGKFTKSGLGTTKLAGANTYSGGTTISGGTLLAGNTAGSATGTGSVTVNEGGTLGGGGTVTGKVILNNGGDLSPGADSPGTPGTILHLGAMTWNGGGTLTLQVGSVSADELIFSGALSKGMLGTWNIQLVDDGVSSTPTTYTLLSFSSTNFVQANFHLELPAGLSGTLVETRTSLLIENLVEVPHESLPLANSDEAGSSPVDSVSVDGSNFVEFASQSELTAIVPAPEPGSAVLLVFGGSALFHRRWRKQKSQSGA